MRSREYEQRRRSIEEQLQADLELIRAGYQAKLRALEMMWLHSAEGDGEAPRNEVPAGAETPRETAPRETRTDEPAAVSRRRDVLGDVEAVLPGLPELFEKRDLVQALGYEPSRSTLFRALDTLREEGKIEIVLYSTGGTRTQYQKLTPLTPP
jgi:hypothetical protein